MSHSVCSLLGVLLGYPNSSGPSPALALCTPALAPGVLGDCLGRGQRVPSHAGLRLKDKIFFFFFEISQFISGCTGSSLLTAGFLSLP